MTEKEFDKVLFERAESTLRVQGILSIVFGGLGILFGLILCAVFLLGSMSYYATYADVTYGLIMSIFIFVFGIIPHIYLVISGAALVRRPQPGVARTLTIINLVVSLFWNLIILIFAIISLTQSGDYERYFPKQKSKE